VPDEVDAAKIALEVGKAIAKEAYLDTLHPSAAKIGGILSSIMDVPYALVLLATAPASRVVAILKKNLRDYGRRLESSAAGDLHAPPLEIAAPIVDRLSYVEDDDLRRLYIELLAKASDSSLEACAHPSFIGVLESMSPDEAKLLPFLKDNFNIPFVWIRLAFPQDPGQEQYLDLAPGIDMTVDLTNVDESAELRFPSNTALYLTNFVSLGILIRDLKELSDKERFYVPLYQRFEDDRQRIIREGHNGKTFPAIFMRGYYSTTPYGREFLRAVLPAEQPE
jgi:hypothetical protein